MQAWKIWVDTGGTFTDCIALSPDNTRHRLKVLSTGKIRGRLVKPVGVHSFAFDATWPIKKGVFQDYSLRFFAHADKTYRIVSSDHESKQLVLDSPLPNNLDKGAEFELYSGEASPLLCARMVTGTPLHQPFPPLQMVLGTTKGTNALLEKKGAKMGLVVTKGFADLLEIGNQQRPHIFSLKVDKQPPLYDDVFEIEERVEANGNVLNPFSQKEIIDLVNWAKEKKYSSVAVALLHSYKNPAHETKAAQYLHAAGISYLSLSALLHPGIGYLHRAETAVVNAYLAPIIHEYLASIRQKLPRGNALRIMTSAGGLKGSDHFHPKDSLLSGPAGGVVGAATIAQRLGADKILTLDMGGTSTDVAHFNGEFQYQFSCEVGGFELQTPALSIHTVAAGGGSLCQFDGIKFTVGPESAGASPGPACYGAGGNLTLTDVNLLLGRLDPTSFQIPLDKVASESALDSLWQAANKQETTTQESLLAGFLQIANEKMAEAMRTVSTSKGYDPAEYALLGFGGAGGQHVCQVASLLGMKKIIVPFEAGLLSAYGMGQSVVERFALRQVMLPLSEVLPSLGTLISNLQGEAFEALQQEGFTESEVTVRKVYCYLRFEGQNHSLEIEWAPKVILAEAFKAQYQKLFGHWVEGKTIEVETVKLVASQIKVPASSSIASDKRYSPQPSRGIQSWVGEAWQTIPVFEWEGLQPGAVLQGPCLLVSQNSTTAVDKGWQLTLNAQLDGLMEQMGVFSDDSHMVKPASIQLELFTNRFTAIADEMGALLQRTAFSVNIKERMDFSCALLDASGYLVVNAPHIPVHLGSLGVCVRKLMDALPMEQGDVVLTNHPAFGGSHLPDITLVAPVFYKGKRIGFVANRAHHAEIGGKAPGSMPADAQNLSEEGIVFPPTYLLKKGEAQWEQIAEMLQEGPFPSRAIAENMADLRAALASLRIGTQALEHLCKQFGTTTVIQLMGELHSYTATLMDKRLAALPQTLMQATELLDDGTPLKVNITKQHRKLNIDFTGTGKVHAGNMNANEAIVNSAVIYMLRLMLDKAIPLNEGLMSNIQTTLPDNSILNPTFSSNPHECPAVVGGNTETSQRLTDTLLKAFGLAACSQGTMNNLLFGNERFGYYETIAGGVGAIKGFHGANAVHQHMTNTRITDPEILEFRYPVRLEQFAIRKGSGGLGTWHGGDGVIREITFLKPVTVTVLTQHRNEVPYGVAGGEAGQAGRQFVIDVLGNESLLKPTDSIALSPGERIRIETPGGGGWGKSTQ